MLLIWSLCNKATSKPKIKKHNRKALGLTASSFWTMGIYWECAKHVNINHLLSPTGWQMRNYCSEAPVNVPPSIRLTDVLLPAINLPLNSHYLSLLLAYCITPCQSTRTETPSADVQWFWEGEGHDETFWSEGVKFCYSRPSKWNVFGMEDVYG